MNLNKTTSKNSKYNESINSKEQPSKEKRKCHNIDSKLFTFCESCNGYFKTVEFTNHKANCIKQEIVRKKASTDLVVSNQNFSIINLTDEEMIKEYVNDIKVKITQINNGEPQAWVMIGSLDKINSRIEVKCHYDNDFENVMLSYRIDITLLTLHNNRLPGHAELKKVLTYNSDTSEFYYLTGYSNEPGPRDFLRSHNIENFTLIPGILIAEFNRIKVDDTIN